MAVGTPASSRQRNGRPRRANAAWKAALQPVLIFVIGVSGCGGGAVSQVPTMAVIPGPFEIVITARGELRAARSTPISMPSELTEWQTLEWLADEGSAVREGDPVAVFSAREILLEESDAASRVQLEDLRIQAADRDFDRQELHLVNEMDVVGLERDMAESFSPRDERLYSRNEIIDAAISLEFLRTQKSYLDGESRMLEQRRQTDLELLQLQRQSHQVRLGQLAETKDNLVVRAPHDGVFLLSDFSKRINLQAGSTIASWWPALGDLPDLAVMQARVWVHEGEARGLETGLPTTVVLDARPEHPIQATVESMAGVAAPIEDSSPVRYFEVTLSLEPEVGDRAALKPRHQVTARIQVASMDQVLAVPNHAVFHGAGASWLWVHDGRSFAKREITAGRRSPTRTVIESGLAAGEVIALAAPKAD